MAKKVQRKSGSKGGPKGSTPGTVRKIGSLSGKGDFRFPSTSEVKAIAAGNAKTASATAGLKKLRQTYKSAGYQIWGTTDDGIVLIRPAGKPDSFTLTELKQAFSGLKNGRPNAKSKRSSF